MIFSDPPKRGVFIPPPRVKKPTKEKPVKGFGYRTIFIRSNGFFRWRLVDNFGNVGAEGREKRQCHAVKAASVKRAELKAEEAARIGRKAK